MTVVYSGGQSHANDTDTSPRHPETITAEYDFDMLSPEIGISISPQVLEVQEGKIGNFAVTVANVGGYRLEDVDVTFPVGAECDPTKDTMPADSTEIYQCFIQVDEDKAVEARVEAFARGGLPGGGEVRLEKIAPFRLKALKFSVKIEVTPDGGELTPEGKLQVPLDEGGRGTANLQILVTNDGDISVLSVDVSDNEGNQCARHVGDLIFKGDRSNETCQLTVSRDLTYTATVEGFSPDGDRIERFGSVEIDVVRPSIKVEKVVVPGLARAGDPVRFITTVTNDGEIDLTITNMVDVDVPSCSDNVRRPLTVGAPEIYDCEFVTAATGFTNDVTVTAQLPGGQEIVKSASAQLSVASISIVRTPDSQMVRITEAAAFTVTVTNTGDEPFETVVVTDPKAPDCDRPLGPIAAGESAPPYQCIAKLLNDDTLTITATGHHPQLAPVIGKYENFVDIIDPAILVRKLPHEQMASAGGSARFIIVVANYGDVPLTDVVVTDEIAPVCELHIERMEAGGTLAHWCQLPLTDEFLADLLEPDEFLNISRLTAMAPDQRPVEPPNVRTEDNYYEALVNIIRPDTVVELEDSETQVVNLNIKTLTIRETNSGNVPLTNPFVDLAPLGRTLTKSSPEFTGGDVNGDSILDVGETWEWRVVTIIVSVTDVVVLDGNAPSTTYVATGHGTDPLDNDVTFPSYVGERDTLEVPVSRR